MVKGRETNIAWLPSQILQVNRRGTLLNCKIRQPCRPARTEPILSRFNGSVINVECIKKIFTIQLIKFCHDIIWPMLANLGDKIVGVVYGAPLVGMGGVNMR